MKLKTPIDRALKGGIDMKQGTFFGRPASRARWSLFWGILVCAALAAAGCSSDVTFSPTTPVWTNSVSEIRTLNISGILSAETGACIEATVLFDGQELPGARVLCPDPKGCAKLELEAVAYSPTGYHTISFQPIRQSKEVVRYVAQGTALVSRDGLSLPGASLNLGPSRARLRAGETISFPVELRD